MLAVAPLALVANLGTRAGLNPTWPADEFERGRLIYSDHELRQLGFANLSQSRSERCQWRHHSALGTPSRPDALGLRHQWMAPCVAVDDAEGCCSACAHTLGCVAYTYYMSPRASCCMRQRKPLTVFQTDSSSIAGVVVRPCTKHCRLPLFTLEDRMVHAGQNDTAWLWSPKPLPPANNTTHGIHYMAPPDVRIRVSDVPWVAAMQAKRPPEPPLPEPSAAAPKPRIAVCLSGLVRTLVHRRVWRSVWEHLLDRGTHDLFAVLVTGRSSGGKTGSDESVDPDALKSALVGLRPRRVRFEMDEAPNVPCFSEIEHDATRQFQRWSTCALLAEPFDHDLMLISRPDIMWAASPRLELIGARVQAPDVVLTVNDQMVLVHRARWDTIHLMKDMGCDERCGPAFSQLNEWHTPGTGRFPNNAYCNMMAHFARWSIRHIETFWVRTPRLEHRLLACC